MKTRARLATTAFFLASFLSAPHALAVPKVVVDAPPPAWLPPTITPAARCTPPLRAAESGLLAWRPSDLAGVPGARQPVMPVLRFGADSLRVDGRTSRPAVTPRCTVARS